MTVHENFMDKLTSFGIFALKNTLEESIKDVS
jgi:hypothetical protein